VITIHEKIADLTPLQPFHEFRQGLKPILGAEFPATLSIAHRLQKENAGKMKAHEQMEKTIYRISDCVNADDKLVLGQAGTYTGKFDMRPVTSADLKFSYLSEK